MKIALWWIRRDLRLYDNQALAYAIPHADAVLPVFILDPLLLKTTPYIRQNYLFNCLRSLSNDFADQESSLVVREGTAQAELARLCAESGADLIVAQADYSPYALRRDREVARTLPPRPLHGHTIQPSGTVAKPDGSPYMVYSLAGPA